MNLALESIYNLFGVLHLCVTRFKSVSFRYGLFYISTKFSRWFRYIEIIHKIAILFGTLITLLIFFLTGLSFYAYAMEGDNIEFVKSVAKPSNPKVIYNSLLIDLQRAKFKIVPYSVVQENDPKFFKYVLNTSNSLSFNGKYTGTSYPYSDDPIRSFIETVILDYAKFDIFKDEFYNRVYRRNLLSLGYFYDGLYVSSTTPVKKVDDIVAKFFSNPVRVQNRLQLNNSILSNSYINNMSQQMCTFVEYIQGAKLPNDKIFMFSNRTKFNLKPFLRVNVDNQIKDINLGLCLNDNNITLIFNNEILYNKKNKFDFNLLRPELLKSEVICNTVKIFLKEDVGEDEKFLKIINEKYDYLSGDSISLGFGFHPTDYQIDNKLNITSINFTFNDENTLD